MKQMEIPWTSQKSASEDKLKLAAMAGHMLAAFKVRPMTANEAALYCVEQLGGKQESYRKRYCDLLNACLIREAGTRKCTDTGKTVNVYRVNV
ncbi:hypothetical protein N8510_01265 [bacterium]|nr:hypothetical protein [bacterium]